ncbi:hypothetical protein SUGI_1092100 [Cryptomeria japonica]|nr:hypothetical protein SUGI_1092100 [Cryptomeria japonica]
MLENQVPIVVLITLLEMEEKLNEETARAELLRMIYEGIIAFAHPFSYSLQPKNGESPAQHKERVTKLKEELQLKYKDLKPYDHILGLFHEFILHESKSQSTNEGEKTEDVRVSLQKGHKTPHSRKMKYLMGSATELYNGMKFRPVCVSDDESDKDVSLLRKKGILQSSVGTDKEMADMFNALCNGVTFTLADEDEFSQVKSEVYTWYRCQTMVRIREPMEKNPKFVKAFTVFWGIVLVLAAAVP